MKKKKYSKNDKIEKDKARKRDEEEEQDRRKHTKVFNGSKVETHFNGSGQ